jgi:hypothetical protein
MFPVRCLTDCLDDLSEPSGCHFPHRISRPPAATVSVASTGTTASQYDRGHRSQRAARARHKTSWPALKAQRWS